MNCNGFAQLASTTAQTVPVGGNISFGNITRQCGCGIKQSGNSILLNSKGCYKVNISATLIPNAAGTATISLLQDGVVSPGATASATVAAAATSINLNIVGTANVSQCPVALSLVLTGAASNVTNVSTLIEKA